MEELKKLLRQNLEYSKEMHQMLVKVRRYIIFQQIFNVVKVVVILIPVIFAIIYGLPFLREAADAYRGVLGAASNIQNLSGSSGLSEGLISEFLR